MTNILVSGESHLSLVYAVVFCEQGNDVTLYAEEKTSEEVIALAHETGEPNLASSLISVLNRKLRITSKIDSQNLNHYNLIVMAVDTQTTSSGNRNYDSLIIRLKKIDDLSRGKIPILLLSQVYPGFTRSLSLNSLVVYQVETLVFGTALERARKPEQIILGVHDVHSEIPQILSEIYSNLNCPIHVMVYESAELAKIAINIMLLFSIVGSNLLVRLAEKSGAKWRDIEPILRNDVRIGKSAYVSPSLGMTGDNLPRDAYTIQDLLESYSMKDASDFFSALLRFNSSLLIWLEHQISENSGYSPSGRCAIGLLGISYKVGTYSTHLSPALKLAESLPKHNFVVFDPHVEWASQLSNVNYAQRFNEVILRCETIVLITPWPSIVAELNKVANSTLGEMVLIDPLGSVPDLRKHCKRYFSLV